jgi:uncharacterized protein (DUF885 family)
VDIGIHLQLPIPPGEKDHPGEVWTYDLALAFIEAHSPGGSDFARSELDRYLGWAGQAISYKVGEREWLKIRADARAQLGATFDLKAFHKKALELGPVTFALLRAEML